MIDMSTWKEITVDVLRDLHLDPKNVRLDLKSDAPEVDIVQDLFRNEKAFSLVESICKVGLLTHELPIAVIRDGKIVVVEGNRRIAALKAIQNPFWTPEHHARITKITQDINRDALRKITVKLAPNQDEADQLIAAIHTGSQRVGWSPARQAAFFQAQIDGGKSPQYLIDQYPTVEVKKFIIRSRILNLFREANYEDPELKDYVSARKFPVSVLARLYGYDKFLELVRISIDEREAKVTLESTQEEFDAIAEKIVRDIREKKINTRTLNSAKLKTFEDYMTSLRVLVNDFTDLTKTTSKRTASSGSPARKEANSSRPAQSSGQLARPSNRTGNGTEATESTPSAPQQQTPSVEDGKAKARSALFLDLRELEISPKFPRSIHKIATEISDINIRKFPNATFDLLRTFLEKVIKAYAAEVVNEDIRKHSGSHKGYIQLSQCLTWLEHYVQTNQQTAYIQVINKIRGENIFGSYIATLDHMNAMNHNHLVFATGEEVRNCWDGMESLIKMMLKP
ncbi:hypothetical protein ACFO3J_27940 [Streptomyces polygonati]|uniref:ParB/Sulfiredoxin domain-containing protein n=1 Tax=Streptomyces polygonati TaxID=1617087 RepID=A0ABV8HT72_9ACTN